MYWLCWVAKLFSVEKRRKSQIQTHNTTQVNLSQQQQKSNILFLTICTTNLTRGTYSELFPLSLMLHSSQITLFKRLCLVLELDELHWQFLNSGTNTNRKMGRALKFLLLILLLKN